MKQATLRLRRIRWKMPIEDCPEYNCLLIHKRVFREIAQGVRLSGRNFPRPADKAQYQAWKKAGWRSCRWGAPTGLHGFILDGHLIWDLSYRDGKSTKRKGRTVGARTHIYELDSLGQRTGRRRTMCRGKRV